LNELAKGNGNANKSGSSKGSAHVRGLASTKSANKTTASGISGAVTGILSRTTDGGGGRKAGSAFVRGVSSYRGSARSTGGSVASSGRRGLGSVSTYGTGQNFTRGFTSGARSISVWDAAWAIGKSALSALKTSLRIFSPS